MRWSTHVEADALLAIINNMLWNEWLPRNITKEAVGGEFVDAAGLNVFLKGLLNRLFRQGLGLTLHIWECQPFDSHRC